jgi:hypothetical protein
MAKVDVKLSHQCLVNGAIRQEGEIVELDPKIAADFGEVQGIELPAPQPKPVPTPTPALTPAEPEQAKESGNPKRKERIK